MKKKHLAKIVELGGLAFLGGSALYLARKNSHLQEHSIKMRKEILKYKDKADLFRDSLKTTHAKYMKLRDNLKEHVEDMLDVKSKKFKGWSKDTELLIEHFPEKDLQFLAPDILIAKLSGLIDAFILNKWSIIPSENKKIKPSQLNNGKGLDIYNRNDLELSLGILRNNNHIQNIDYEFILKFYDYYKEKIILKGELPKSYDNEEIEYFFDYTINMILEKS